MSTLDSLLKQSQNQHAQQQPLKRLVSPLLRRWARPHKASVSLYSKERYLELFAKAPVCELCGKETAIAFACFDGFSDWKFVGACTAGEECYAIPLVDFFARPASAVDWLAHMAGKPEMDWESFGAMMRRFREATGSQGGEGPHFERIR